jgi:hypothetical protein
MCTRLEVGADDWDLRFVKPWLLHRIILDNLFFLLANGYIEGTELDGFLREFVASVNSSDTSPEVHN